jgi:transcriptional regulator with XRE-family HTH domain
LNDSRPPRLFAVRGDKLAALRHSHQWSEADAARRAGVSEQLIRDAEAGGPLPPRAIPTLAWLYRTQELRLKPEDLLANPAELAAAPEVPAPLAARVQRWFDGQWNDFNLDVIDELAVPDFVYYSEADVIRGPQPMKQRVLTFRESFDIEIIAERVADLGDFIAVQWRASVNHTGPWLGMPATAKCVSIRGASWVQLVGEKFGDAWDFWDPGLLFAALTKP